MKTIFIHGLGQSATEWLAVLEHMRIEDYHLVDVNSAISNGLDTYNELYHHINEEITANSNGYVRLVGLSLGGILAMNYTLKNPELVERCVVIGAPARMPSYLLSLQNLIFRIMPEKTFIELGISKKQMISLAGSMKNIDFSSRIKESPSKFIFMAGKSDGLNIGLMRRSLPQGTQINLIENAGHEVNKDNPELLAKELERCL